MVQQYTARCRSGPNCKKNKNTINSCLSYLQYHFWLVVVDEETFLQEKGFQVPATKIKQYCSNVTKSYEQGKSDKENKEKFRNLEFKNCYQLSFCSSS